MLIDLLIRSTINNYDHPENAEVRLAYGRLCGTVGIVVNSLLFLLKALVALMTGSVAIAADAVNNLSDASTAAITLIGFKLAGKVADNEHPFGHGRLEYIAGLIVAVVIMAVGIHFLQESLMKIFRPEKLVMSDLAVKLYAATFFFKLWLLFFHRDIGRRISSSAIQAAAFDSLSDLLITAVVLLALLLSPHSDFPIDGVAGTAVALAVLFGGVKIIRHTIDPLLGIRPDKRLVTELRERLLACDGISGVHDIIIHNYGPNQHFATAHAEVDCEENLLAVHDILEAAEVEIARTMPMRLTLHCDPFVTNDPTVKLWHERALLEVKNIDHKFKLYDFHLDSENSGLNMHFNLLIPRKHALSEEKITKQLTNALQKHDSTLTLKIDYVNSFI